jgi:hypothetical protein
VKTLLKSTAANLHRYEHDFDQFEVLDTIRGPSYKFTLGTKTNKLFFFDRKTNKF